MIRHFEECGFDYGCCIKRGAPRVSQHFFVDDSILFVKATAKECDAVKQILEIFKKASGLEVNFNKSSSFFSTNVLTQLHINLCNVFNVVEDDGNVSYLDMALLVGKNKKKAFDFIK